jgi:hypothetical protein
MGTLVERHAQGNDSRTGTPCGDGDQIGDPVCDKGTSSPRSPLWGYRVHVGIGPDIRWRNTTRLLRQLPARRLCKPQMGFTRRCTSALSRSKTVHHLDDGDGVSQSYSSNRSLTLYLKVLDGTIPRHVLSCYLPWPDAVHAIPYQTCMQIGCLGIAARALCS